MKKEPVIVERIFNAPVGRVWKALTDRDQMKHWYFDLAKFKPEPGFEFYFDGENKGVIYHHICKVTEVINEEKLCYSWKYQGFEGSSLVCIELFAEGDQTRLKLTHSNLESFPQDIPDFSKENFVMGWTQIIGSSLREYLEKQP